MGTIVVGIDYSTEAKAALRFALEEARFRRARLLAVHAIDAFGSYPSLAVDVSAVHRAAEDLLVNVTGEVTGGDEVEIERRVVERRSCRSRRGVFAAPICLSSARAGMAASLSCCSARSASSVRSTLLARS